MERNVAAPAPADDVGRLPNHLTQNTQPVRLVLRPAIAARRRRLAVAASVVRNDAKIVREMLDNGRPRAGIGCRSVDQQESRPLPRVPVEEFAAVDAESARPLDRRIVSSRYLRSG